MAALLPTPHCGGGSIPVRAGLRLGGGLAPFSLKNLGPLRDFT